MTLLHSLITKILLVFLGCLLTHKIEALIVLPSYNHNTHKEAWEIIITDVTKMSVQGSEGFLCLLCGHHKVTRKGSHHWEANRCGSQLSYFVYLCRSED